jgi:hypothetical protein
MQMASSQILLVPLQLVVPGVESVASYLDRMLFIILQVRSEQTAACVSLVMMIPKTKHITILNTFDVNSLSEGPLDTFISPKIRKDGMLTLC